MNILYIETVAARRTVGVVMQIKAAIPGFFKQMLHFLPLRTRQKYADKPQKHIKQ
jgi:hypothetical protein